MGEQANPMIPHFSDTKSLPEGQKKRGPRFVTPQQIRRAIVKVYRAQLAGDLSSSDARARVQTLLAIHEVNSGAVLAKRIEALERLSGNGKAK